MIKRTINLLSIGALLIVGASASAFSVQLSVNHGTAFLFVTGGSTNSYYAIESNRWGGWEQIIVTEPDRLWLWTANKPSELFRARLLPPAPAQ